MDPLSRKLLILGLDGFSPALFRHLIDEGLLPYLGGLLDEGLFCRMRSTTPPNSIPAWICMAAGRNPGKVGLFDFLYKNGYSLKLVSSRLVRAEPIWSLLSEEGHKVGVVNVPGTYPPGGVRGFMVSGLMTPSSRECVYPRLLSRLLARELRYYKLDVIEWAYFDEAQLIKDAILVARSRARLTIKLTKLVEPDFLFLVFTTPDRIFHPLWELIDPDSDRHLSRKKEKILRLLERYWLELDGLVAKIIEVFKPTLTFLVSDHGFGPKEATFFTNECLRRKGLLGLKKGLKPQAMISLCHIMAITYNALGETGIFYNLYFLANEAVGLRKLWECVVKYFDMASLTHVDWSRTYAFSCAHTPVFNHVYINLAGREPKGAVPPRRYEDVRENVIGCIEDAGREYGARVKVYRREEVYSGPYTGEAPDILIEVGGGSVEFNPSLGFPYLLGPYFTDHKTTGTHRPYGIFLAHGPDLASNSAPREISIYDVMPTALAYYGLDIPGDVDGKPIRAVLG